MSITVVEEKIRKLPDTYVDLVNDYVDCLLERAKKSAELAGSLLQSERCKPD